MTQVGSSVSLDEYLRVIGENNKLKQENDMLKADKGIISLMNKLIYVD